MKKLIKSSHTVIIVGLLSIMTLFSAVGYAADNTERPDLSHMTDQIVQQGQQALENIKQDMVKTSYEWNFEANELLARLIVNDCIAKLGN